MIFASNNKGKLKEVKEIFSDYKIKSLEESGIDIDVVEDQSSFYGNALKKAQEIYEIAKEETIADDSGLCIDIFAQWPGVLTHRFLGENTTSQERNAAIIEKLKDIPLEKRTASVVCNLVYYNGKDIIVGEGVLRGYISIDPKGSNGFGFDEIFMLDDGRTLGELSSEEKNNMSARYLAALDLKNKLKDCHKRM